MKVIDTTKEPRWLRQFTPDYYAESVRDINFELLKSHGVRVAVFDVDSTLVPHEHIELSPESEQFLLEQKEAGHVDEFYIATNRRTNDIEAMAGMIGARVVHARSTLDSKPWKRYFNRLFKVVGRPPDECVMVGDKVFTDILGGNRSGMQTVLVERLGEDSRHDKLMPFRRIEKALVNRYRYIEHEQ